MQTPLDALYAYAVKRDDLTRWLPNEDISESYRSAATYADEQRAELCARLGAGDLELFRKFLDNADEAHEMEGEMLFCQGLSIGLRLGTLTLLA